VVLYIFWQQKLYNSPVLESAKGALFACGVTRGGVWCHFKLNRPEHLLPARPNGPLCQSPCLNLNTPILLLGKGGIEQRRCLSNKAETQRHQTDASLIFKYFHSTDG
jgi:hypothetical protein